MAFRAVPGEQAAATRAWWSQFPSSWLPICQSSSLQGPRLKDDRDKARSEKFRSSWRSMREASPRNICYLPIVCGHSRGRGCRGMFDCRLNGKGCVTLLPVTMRLRNCPAGFKHDSASQTLVCPPVPWPFPNWF
jgi:hypothetical protein